MATSLEVLEKEVRIVHIHTNTCHFMKNYLVDPEIIVLK